MNKEVDLKTIIVIGALPRSLYNFRGELIRRLVSHGYKVIAMSAPATDGEILKIKDLGADFVSYPVSRNSINPFKDINTLLFFRKFFKLTKPEYIISYTIKPVVWSGIATFGLDFINFSAMITGLGFAFDKSSFFRKILMFIVSFLYRLSLSRAKNVIFQNRDDLDFFVSKKIVSSKVCHKVPGSGVPIEQFPFTCMPPQGMVFLLISRLLNEKGIRYFVEAAKKIKHIYPLVRFQLLGPTDPSLDGISIDEVTKWHDEGIIEYLGETIDVRPYLANCHVFVLPSYYGEGLPRTILEAMSMGKAILTTDNVGCREPVVDGLNGFLVPIKNSTAIAEKMKWFIEHPTETKKMGVISRSLIEDKFDVKKVNEIIFDILKI